MSTSATRFASFARLARRDPELVILAVRAYVLLVLMRGVITLLPLQRIARHLGAAMAETPVSGLTPPQLRYARRVAWSVEKVAPHTPTNSNCYPQALAARWLLRRQRVPSTLYYGAAFEPDRPALAGHVWLRCGPVTVTGGAAGRTFRALASYADAPRARHGFGPRGRASD